MVTSRQQSLNSEYQPNRSQYFSATFVSIVQLNSTRWLERTTRNWKI